MEEIDIEWIRTQRAASQLEIELWNVINEFLSKKPTKSESSLTKINILHLLSHMSARMATEIQWETLKNEHNKIS